MYLQKVEVELLGTLINEVTKGWDDLKDSPDVFYQRDPDQHTYLNLPHLYLEYSGVEGRLEIMKRVGEEEWKIIETKGRTYDWIKKEIQPYLKDPCVLSFPTGILNPDKENVNYSTIKYHHYLNAELLEEINTTRPISFFALYYVRYCYSANKTYRILSSEEVMKNLWFTIHTTKIPGDDNTWQVDVFSPWYTALTIPIGHAPSVVTYVNGEHWEEIEALLTGTTQDREKMKELLGKVITLRKQLGDKHYQFFCAWSQDHEGKNPLFTPYYGYVDPTKLV